MWVKVKSEKILATKKNNTWELVTYRPNMNVLRSKWVYRIKYNAGETINRHKVRLVAKGYDQTPGIDFTKIYSRVMKSSTMKIMFSLAASFNWDIRHLNINKYLFKWGSTRNYLYFATRMISG